MLSCFSCIEEQRKCKLCHSAWVAFYALFAFPDSTRSRRVLSMEGERGRLKPAATAGRAPMLTGRQRWATVQGKASDQHLRFAAEDIWGKSVDHMGQIQKKKSKALFPIACISTLQCSICSMSPTGKRLHCCSGSVFASTTAAWPGKGLLIHSVTLHRVAGNWEISVEKKDEEHSSKMAT